MINGSKRISRPVRWAMVGGGANSQIGYIHRSAALRDQNFALIAGAFDIDPERGRAFGEQLGVDPERCYSDYLRLIEQEARRPDGIEALSVATPNGTHFSITKAALEAGLHVVCEKPLCFTLEEAETLKEIAKANQRIVGVTYGYAGHQLIEQARQMIAAGELGEIRMVHMQFAHGFHSAPVETQNEATKWRVDPSVAGPSYVLGDVGTHPLYIAEVMLPELKIKRLQCNRQSFVKSRAPLEDNAYTLMEYEGGAMGWLWSSAVNAGSMHGQKVRVIGSRASLEWWDERPNQLSFEVQGQPAQTLERGMGYLHPDALLDDRIGGGHPEGLFEAWSNLYYRFALAMNATARGDAATLQSLRYPGIDAGVEGVRWVQRCVESADQGGIWIDY
ncbi:Gfo/Idh/MocA family oxidoreductase [Pseudomonas alliivorans]|uniref:Gfo/Idh/MocA family oxidoreductase n=1 Tax=Pseudomonas alliivorans TaxID=2810613 RepID=A0ABS4C3T1_9PSED|nr:Gfo/Idh/MocA family oxidoreductase [Pseudomonas alliivorans]MBP0945017.1 Gfo/Idh/MocA family oxidoreductase [Pseudomonas alliivorans]MEE4324535.1 Gfo/Idh/MocA family oxidoreductase [Pseudomonas alliivorans]MEE4334206.1 Gfo/Idh/MocA family oxidoreductase [Pseudomonas alliivorans]MEE4341562.1 Gfo/Idh/MocA family oxidoreductase [Pseudomonas alliivorans]MEE4366065.1 Gfo/Idh/MocA family oxidoreductase [Pseudomonas alliivorans]